MKKIFTLIAAALMAVGAQAQTAKDSYLNIANYASIDEAGIRGVLDGGHLYSYDETNKILVISAFVGYQSSVSTNEGTQAWITYNEAGSSNVDEWAADAPFKGSAYYQMANNNALTHRAAAINNSRTYRFRVSNITKVAMLGSTGGSNRTVTMTVYEVVNGTPSETASGTAVISVNALTKASVENLDKSKIYEIVFTNASSSNSRLYELAFYAGAGDTPVTPSDPTDPKAWDFTTTSDATKAALSENANWVYDDTNARYSYNVEVAADTYVDLASIGFAEGAGLEVGRTGNKMAAGSIRVDIDNRLQLNASNGAYKLKNLAKDDVVVIVYASASAEDRTFAVTNADKTELVAPADKSKQTESLTIKADGDLTLVQSKAINVYSISINGGSTGITDVKVVEPSTVKDDAIYNLSGQKVNKNYKGVVIKNGVKTIQK